MKRTKTRNITFALTEEEYAAIEAAAKDAYLSANNYSRSLTLRAADQHQKRQNTLRDMTQHIGEHILTQPTRIEFEESAVHKLFEDEPDRRREYLGSFEDVPTTDPITETEGFRQARQEMREVLDRLGGMSATPRVRLVPIGGRA